MDKNFSISLPESIDRTIDHAVNPIAKVIGDTFSDLLYLAVGDISYLAEKRRIKREAALQKFREDITQKVGQIPPDQLSEPDMQIVGQAIQKSQFCIEHDELRQMFANLMASSVTRDRAPLVRPCFADILSQLTPFDVRLLLHIRDRQQLPIVNLNAVVPDGIVNILCDVYIDDDFPDVREQSISLESMKGMGIVELNYLEKFADSTVYDKYRGLRLENALTGAVEYTNIISSPGIARLTELGKSFLNAVL